MATFSSIDRSARAALSMALPSLGACLPAPRSGAAPARSKLARPALVPLTQRSPRERALALTSAGFPGLTLNLEHERASVHSQVAEEGLNRVGLAYLQIEHALAAPPAEQSAAVADMLRQLESPRPPLVSLELLGPVSLALQLVDEQERPLAYSPPLREALVQHLVLRAGWLHEQIGTQVAVLICLDEPFLDALASPFSPLDHDDGFELLARTLADLPAPRALCLAGAPNWGELLSLPTELVYCDAFEHGAALIGAAEAVVAFIQRGGVIAWGIVPNDPAALAQERVETLVSRFESSVEYLAAAGNLGSEQIRAAALISTSGSLTHLPAELAAHAVALCGDVSAYLRTRYQLEEL